MANPDYRNPSTWRHRTPKGIPFRIVTASGQMNPLDAEITSVFLIRATDIRAFCEELWPAPSFKDTRPDNLFAAEVTAGIFVHGAPPKLVQKNPPSYPNFPSLRPTSVRFTPHIDGLPIDPFAWDTAAPSGTYGAVVSVEVVWANSKYDPRSYLLKTGQSTGEYLNQGTPPGIKYSAVAGVDQSDPFGNPVAPGSSQPVKNPILPATVVVPEEDWSLKRVYIPGEYFENWTLPLLRYAQGTVNSSISLELFNAPAETLLFVGFSVEEIWSWRLDTEAGLGGVWTPTNGSTPNFRGDQYVTVELKFLEKYIHTGNSGDPVAGHNHAFIPEIGWRKIRRANGDPPYPLFNFDKILAVIGSQEAAPPDAPVAPT